MKQMIISLVLISTIRVSVFAQCTTPLNLQNPKNLASANLLLQHYLSVRRDSSAAKPYLYVAAKATGLIIYNIGNLSSPSTVTTIPVSAFSGLDVNSITQAGNYIYLALGDIFNSSSQKSGMAIVDISNPQLPQVKSVYSFTANSGAGGVAVQGNYAFLAAMQNGILVLDISNKSSIQFVSQLKPSVHFPKANPNTSELQKINARSLVVNGDRLYLCYDAGGVRVINVNNKSSIKESGRYSNSLLNNRARAYNNMVLEDTLIYVAADYCGMEVLNVKDTSNIKRIGWWNPWKCETTANTWFNSPGHTNEIEYDPSCKVVFMSAGKSDLMAVSVANPLQPDSCTQFGLKTDSAGTWGLGRYANQVYLAYISTWPLYIPFRSEWSGIKILTYNNSCATGLPDYSLAALKVFPNPAADLLRISGIAGQQVKLSLYSVDGKLVYETTSEGNDQVNINTRLFARGVYFLRISNTEMTLNREVILAD